MADLFERLFTAANGTAWDDVGFTRVYGGAVDAVVQANEGWCGASTSERIYLSTAWPQFPNHKVLMDMDWIDAAGAGRVGGFVLRFTADGDYGYAVEVDSNVGTCRVRIRRRYAGVWADVLAWDDVSATIGSARLNAGETFTARIENTDASTVNIKLYAGTDLLADEDDTHANRIESGGRPGIIIGSTSTNGDIACDNFTVRDFEDEWSADAGETLDEEVAIIVDGVSFSWVQLRDAGVKPLMPRDGIGRQDGVVCQFATEDRYHETNAILYAGAIVQVSLAGSVVCYGRLRLPRISANAGAQGQMWDLVGPDALAADVRINHPDTGENTILWNLSTDHADYDSTRDDVTIGEAIEELLDNGAGGDGGLRDQGAAPPDEDDPPYDSAETALLDMVIPGIAANGDVVAGVEELLSYTKYVRRIHPVTRVWHFLARDDGTATDIDQADETMEWELIPRLEKAFTAIEAIGNRPEQTSTVLENGGGGLIKDWTASLETTYDHTKANKNYDSGTVGSSGSSGGQATMNPSGMTMEASEWVGCYVTFDDGDEAGETYEVDSNTALQFVFVDDWRNGGPAASDAFRVKGAGEDGGRDNGYRDVGRRYALTDTDLGIKQDACALVEILKNNLVVKTRAFVNTPQTDGEPATVTLDLPSVGLIDTTGGVPDPCTEGDADFLDEATVRIEVPTFSRSVPTVPKRRYPTTGYYGSGYTLDSSKWSGGGKPGRGDPSVMRTYPLPVPQYDGSAAQQAEVDKVLAQLAGYLSMIPREVRVTIKNRLDTTWIGLGRLLTISNTGGPSTGLESADDLFVYAVEYDVEAKTTTIHAGTQGAGDYQPDKLRQAYLSKLNATRVKAMQRLLEDFAECWGTQQEASPQPAPVQMCGDQVTVDVDGTARTVGQLAPSSSTCQPDDPSTPALTCTECSSDAPLAVANALVNAGAFQGLTGNAKIKTYDFGTSDYDAVAGENSVQATLCCLIEHIQELWNSIYITGKVVNDIAAVVSGESVRHCGQMNALRTAILALQACMPYKVDDPTGASNPCPIVDPGAIINCDICSDYCAGAIPAAGACLEVPD